MRGTSHLLLSALCLGSVLCTDYQECSDYKGKKCITIKSVEVSNCPSGKVCKLLKGEKASIEVKFEAEEEISAMNVTIHGVMNGMKLPYPGSYNKNCCDGAGLECPIQAKQPQEFTMSLPVNKNYPTVPSVIIRMQFDDAGCIMIPSAVVGKRKE